MVRVISASRGFLGACAHTTLTFALLLGVAPAGWCSPSEDLRERPSREDVESYIDDAAAQHRVSGQLVRAIIEAESGFDDRVVSPAGAVGLMQLMPRTARDLGVSDPLDARQNIFGGTRYLRRLLDRYAADVSLSAAAYHAGGSAVARHNGIPPSRKTRAYVQRVTGLLGSPRYRAAQQARQATALGTQLVHFVETALRTRLRPESTGGVLAAHDWLALVGYDDDARFVQTMVVGAQARSLYRALQDTCQSAALGRGDEAPRPFDLGPSLPGRGTVRPSSNRVTGKAAVPRAWPVTCGRSSKGLEAASAGGRGRPLNDDRRSFDEFLKRRDAAARALVNGDPAPLNKVATRSAPATSFGPRGGTDAAGESRFEILQTEASGGLAYWAGFQRATGPPSGAAAASFDLRVTELFRREGEEWQLVHRDADSLFGSSR